MAEVEVVVEAESGRAGQEAPEIVIDVEIASYSIQHVEVEEVQRPQVKKPSRLPLRRWRKGDSVDTPTTGSGTPTGTDGHRRRLAIRKWQKAADRSSVDTTTSGTETPTDGPRRQPPEEDRRGSLPFLTELLRSRRRKRPTRHRPNDNPDVQTEVVRNIRDPIRSASPLQQQQSISELGQSPAIKMGQLHKSTRSRAKGSKSGPARERRFRLTEEGLEYFQLFSNVKIKRSFPLTSVDSIVYSPETDPTTIELMFPTTVMTLISDSPEEARDWAQKITETWSKWQLPPQTPDDGRTAVQDSLLQPTPLHPQDASSFTGRSHEQEDIVMCADDDTNADDTPPSPRGRVASDSSLGVPLPPPAPRSLPSTSDNFTPSHRPRSHTIGMAELRRDSTQLDMEQSGTYRRRKVGRQAVRIKKAVRLRPKLEKSKRRVEGGMIDASTRLHDDYAMIKYPRKKWAIPAERVFRVDKDNLQILWRKRETAKFNFNNALSLHRVLEIREGQDTDKFARFPYEEVAEQSFSLMFEGEQKGLKYVRLRSLDLICDHPNAFQEWIDGLRTLVPGPLGNMASSRFDNTDPTVLWLKTLWTCTSVDHEITQKDSIAVARRLRPGLSDAEAKLFNRVAHQHQFRGTINTGHALRWDGFVLMFNLICGMTGRLFELFKEYAKTYPSLGLTQAEFREFLIHECCWEQRMCTANELQLLMHHHDYHHRSFKKYIAENKPLEYQIASGLLSYAGFLSFLRSKDNSVINVDHEAVYQDMTQPLSHYFINSSHNTYLEADQLYGKSSTDAYARALIQGSRCIEIDCWDDTLGVTAVDEPLIYHGFTLTTRLPFREVIQAIRKYAFQTSLYPVIISIENHCSSSQQSKMARIFHALMGDVLATENLTESEGRTRLPSPLELQGKIILKLSFKQAAAKAAATRVNRQPKPSPSPLRSPAPSTSVPAANQRQRSSSSLTSQDSQTESPTLVSVSPDGTSPEHSGTESVFRVSYSGSHNRRSLREWTRSVEQNQSVVLEDDDQELIFEETAEDLKRLIVYCRSISIKPWSWKKQQQTTVSEMFSFGEPSALRHCRDSAKELLACTERQLVRTYPRGTRFDSSNYSPIIMWNCGIQMAALNFQTPDIPMHLNQGLFRLNGGCGYILKPAVMRNKEAMEAGDSAPFLPDMTEPIPGVPPVELEIELVSGQRLCPWAKKATSVSVEIHTYGINHDCDRMPPASHNDSFWPQWQKGMNVFHKKISMPELCLVYFRVEVQLKARRNAQLYGQNCIPLNSLMPGIKFVPLRTPGGELIQESGLFVRIGKNGRNRLTVRKHNLHHQDTMEESESWEVWSEEHQQEGEGEEEIDVTQSIVPGAVGRRKNFQRQGGRSSGSSGRRFSSPPLVNCTLTSIAETTEEDESHSHARMERGQGQDTTTPTHSQVVSAEVHESEVEVEIEVVGPQMTTSLTRHTRTGLESQPTANRAGVHNMTEEDESVTITYI